MEENKNQIENAEKLDILKKKYVGKYFINSNETSFVYIESIFGRETIDGEVEFFFIGIVVTCDDYLKTNIEISKSTHNLFLTEPEYTETTIMIWFVKVQIRINNLLKIK